ncbi:uncharacterized protein EAF01_007618 [Botrytis porri]|uniref:Uncharacterized protein n=1 Tax=Botrytis porri TaxID=87229 RepID=A0A4Z1KPL5_9HELO|nr:uncharacterized protein EAF01_007618 [Botrytis porri]KAF7900316.1 hypothetical protein EAF01_007618 [Botrytis porri]TGO87490.1 hypothetical protein BPOR_0222g00050 [Botrytis porri]
MFVVSRPSRHFLADEVDKLVRNFELLRPYKQDSSAKFEQAKTDLVDIMKRLRLQHDKDQETVEQLRRRLIGLVTSKLRAQANRDFELCDFFDADHQDSSIRRDKLNAELRKMGEDIAKMSGLLTEE